MESIGERLRKARDRAGLSLGQVHQYEGIQKGHLSEMERGLKSPTAETLIRLAQRYHTSADYLLGLEGGEDDPATATEQEQFKQLIDEFTALSDRNQRLVLSYLRMMRQLEEEEREHERASRERPPHIVGGAE